MILGVVLNYVYVLYYLRKMSIWRKLNWYDLVYLNYNVYFIILLYLNYIIKEMVDKNIVMFYILDRVDLIILL